MNSGTQGERDWRSPQFRRAVGEVVVVAGASLLIIFWVIPAQTTPGRELGLSPQLIPTVCSAAIGLLAVFRFIATLLSVRPAEAIDAAPFRYAIGMIAATAAGIAAITYLGWPTGGAILSLLVVLMLGERRPLILGALPVSVAILLYLIQLTGI